MVTMQKTADTPREAYISSLIRTELSPDNLMIYKLIRDNALLQNYSSEKVRGFISFVHDKGGAGTSTLTINSAIAFAERGLDVYVLDINPQNPSMNEVTRPIRKNKVVVLYNNGRRIDAGKLDPSRVDCEDVFAVNSIDEISPENRTIDTVIVEESVLDSNMAFFESLVQKGMTVYYFGEIEENGKKYHTALLHGTYDHKRIDPAVGASIEEMIGRAAPRTNKMKNLLNTHLDKLRRNTELISEYFSSTLVPGLYVLPTEPNTFKDGESEQLSSRISLISDRLRTDVEDTVIRSIDFKELSENVKAQTESFEDKQKNQITISIVDNYVRETIKKLHDEGAIRDKILIADTSTDYNVVLDAANMSEPIIIMSPQKTAISEVKGLVSKLRHARFRSLLETYRDGSDVSKSAKEDLSGLVERYLLPDGELRRIQNTSDLASGVDSVFQREAVEEIFRTAEEMGKTAEVLPLFISKAVMGEQNAYGFQSELKSVNKRTARKYDDGKKSDTVFNLVKANAKRIEDRIGKEIKLYESQRKHIDEKHFYSAIEQAIDRALCDEIKRFYAERKGKEHKRYEAVDFVLKLKDMGYDSEIRKILKTDLTALEKREACEGGVKLYGKVGGNMKSINDKDAIEVIRNLGKRYIGVEHVFTIIDKYKSLAEGANGQTIGKESFIQSLPAELKQEAAAIFEKYEKEANVVKESLDYGNQISLLMNIFPEDKTVRLEAVSELMKIEDCKINIAGLVGKDGFVESAMVKTFAPFKLLDKDYRISINGTGELAPAEGSETNAARDIDAFVENLLNGGDSCSLEKFAHELAYEQIQRDRIETSARDETRAAEVSAGAAGAKGISSLLVGARKLFKSRRKED